MATPYLTRIMESSAEHYGLNKRSVLKIIGSGHIAIVKKIKSRILRKDAEKIIDMAKKIQEKEPNAKVSLICYDNICSKSILLLQEAKIDIIIEE